MKPSPNKKARREGGRTEHPYVITPQRRINWLWGVFLVAATILAYQSVWQAGCMPGRSCAVTANKLLIAPDGLRRIWFSLDSPSQYFPLVYTTFRIEHALWGLNPAGYHWVNILLHSANALLVWRLLRRLRVPGAWLAAAIFALHPVQVESVAWITERKNVLMGFFFLLALLSWAEFVEEQSRRIWKFYALALIFYAFALFSRTTACTLPAALLLILWLKKGDHWRTKFGGRAIRGPRTGHGIGKHLVGTISSRDARSVVCNRIAGTGSHREPGVLVLFGQIILACEAHLHLSAMAGRGDQPA